MPMADLPSLPPAIVCSISASAAYGLPANIVLAVADMEGGRPGQWVRNANGTSDVGLLQFNTHYLKTLARYGITTADVAADNCYPYQLAAWRLVKHIQEDAGDLWTRVADYHSRTPRFNAPYRVGVIRRAAYWARWLTARLKTFEMPNPLGARQVDEEGKAGSISAAAARADPADGRTTYVPRTITIRDAGGP
jgi:Transglycosylase SLT domain